MYRTVADLVRASFSRPVRFHLFSDEVIPEHAFSGHDVVAHRGHAPEVDLVMMSSCDAIIGPNSSFSQWASFVGNAPIHVLEPEIVAQLETLLALPESKFSVYGSRRFGDKAAVRISAASAISRQHP